MPLRQRSVSDLHTGVLPKRPVRSSSLPQHQQQLSRSASYSIVEETSNNVHDQSPFYMERPSKPRRSPWLRNLAFSLIAVGVVFLLWPRSATEQSVYWITGARNARLEDATPDEEIVPCRGPSGRVLDGDRSTALDEAYIPDLNHAPWAGSYEVLDLPQTWTTGARRYKSYRSPRGGLKWEDVRWGDVQSQCVRDNSGRLGETDLPASFARRLKIGEKGEADAPPFTPRSKSDGGRTAIVLRAWDTFEYTESDLLFIRSLISETNLAYGGEYSVFILVDVKRGGAELRKGDEEYQRALDVLVPAEFRDMAVLFDERILKHWYKGVKEHRTVMQVNQPLQIFAKFHPEYEHFWQIEMDVRFTGHAGHLLHAFGSFSRNEPRKQSYQRATHFYTSSYYSSYEDFTHQVNSSLGGDDPMYRGVRIPEVPLPINDQLNPPLTENPHDDDFEWGVDEEADCIILDAALNVTLSDDFLFKSFVYNFTLGNDLPRYHAPPAIARTSWNLLMAVHDAQRLQGLAMPGESIMPSFALYHNLKLSLPPMPIYGRHQSRFGNETDYPELHIWANGGAPRAENDGMGRGAAVYAKQFLSDEQKSRRFPNMGPSYRFAGTYPGDLWKAWMTGDLKHYDIVTGELPALQPFDGELWMPSMLLHPVKTNVQRPENIDWILQPGAIPGTHYPNEQQPESTDGAMPGMPVEEPVLDETPGNTEHGHVDEHLDQPSADDVRPPDAEPPRPAVVDLMEESKP